MGKPELMLNVINVLSLKGLVEKVITLAAAPSGAFSKPMIVALEHVEDNVLYF